MIVLGEMVMVMRVFRHGRVLDGQHDMLFSPQEGNGVVLNRSATDNYIRPRTPHVDCTTTHYTPADPGYDDGTQTNRWLPVTGKSLPVYQQGIGWQFTPNTAICTNYNIANSIHEYTARCVIPAPYFPVDVIPRQWCLSNVEVDDVVGKTVSGVGIRWGNVFWGVGHYRIRCCPNQQVEESACLILDVNGNREYHFPMWGSVSAVDLTIQRLSSSTVRVSATGNSNTHTHTFTHTLSWTTPYRVEYYLYQLSQNCTAPETTPPYHLVSMRSPSINYSYVIELPIEYLQNQIYLQIKSIPDVFTTPSLLADLELQKDGEEEETVDYGYNPETNLYEPEHPFRVDGVERARIIIATNQILDRVSVLVGGVMLHYTPAPHQPEWLAVLPVEMEQTGIPDGIIPSGYNVLGIADYARVLPSGRISVIPAEYARVLTIHLQENSV